MDAWVIWLIVAVVFAVAEIVNLSFYLFPFAIGRRQRPWWDWPAGGWRSS
jgi:membrane protein implicated in regulation of membrane protease activity